MKKNLLRFTPTAWAKLVWLRDAGDTEIAGFGVSGKHDLLLVNDMMLVGQQVSWGSAEFDDTAVANYFDAQVDLGRRPEEFARIWIHTHPGDCPLPSGTDEETFVRVFGRADWAVMFILARGGKSYARLRYHVGPTCDVLLGVEVDYSQEFRGSDREAWRSEYRHSVRRKTRAALPVFGHRPDFDLFLAEVPTDEWYDRRFDLTTIDGWREEVDDEFIRL